MWLHLQYLPPVFCEAIGILKPCTVTLKTSTSSTRTWQARVAPYQGTSHHVSWLGWTQFCRENRIKVGDVCTIKISKTTLWHVIINSPEWWMGSVASMHWVRCSYHGSSSVEREQHNHWTNLCYRRTCSSSNSSTCFWAEASRCLISFPCHFSSNFVWKLKIYQSKLSGFQTAGKYTCIAPIKLPIL